MSISSSAATGSATIIFRKLLDASDVKDALLLDALSYAVDVDWVAAYMGKKPLDSSFWMSTSSRSPSMVQQLLDALVTILTDSEGVHSVSRVLNALDTVGATLRAIVARPSTDTNLTTLQAICGPSLDETALIRLLNALTRLISSRSRVPPVVKSSAIGCLATLVCGHPNLHQNVLCDHICTLASTLFPALMDVLRETTLARSVGWDALVMLVVLCCYQRFDRRNPFLLRARDAATHRLFTRTESLEYSSDSDGEDVPSPLPPKLTSHPPLILSPATFSTPVRLPADHSPAAPTPTTSSVITGVSLTPASEFVQTVVKGLQSTSSHCNAQLCSVAQAPILSQLEGRTVDGSATHVITPASLVLKSSSASGGLFSMVSGAVASLASLSSSIVGSVTGALLSGSAPAVSGKADPVLLACCGRIGAHCPPNDPLRSPLQLPFATRTAILLIAFHDLVCASPDSMWLGAGGPTWRGHAGGVPLPSCAPELLRQYLSLCSFALQANDKDLPKLALLVLQRLVEASSLPVPSREEEVKTPGSGSAATLDDVCRARAMHTVIFSRTLDPDSTQLTLYERGLDGGFVALKVQALPLSVAIAKMTCHAIGVRTKGKLNAGVLTRALRVLHRVVYHCVHGAVSAVDNLPRLDGGRKDHSSVRALGCDWIHTVRCLLAVCKRLTADGLKPCEDNTRYAGRSFPDDIKDVMFETARVLDICMSGFTDKARLDAYYEFVRERNVLEGFKTLLIVVYLPTDAAVPESLAFLPKPSLDRLIASLPPRIAMAARNIQAVLSQLGDLMSKAAFALRSTGEGLLSEEDVIQMVTESSPWKNVPPADRFQDSYMPYIEGNASDASVFGALTRGIVEDLGPALKM